MGVGVGAGITAGGPPRVKWYSPIRDNLLERGAVEEPRHERARCAVDPQQIAPTIAVEVPCPERRPPRVGGRKSVVGGRDGQRECEEQRTTSEVTGVRDRG